MHRAGDLITQWFSKTGSIVFVLIFTYLKQRNTHDEVAVQYKDRKGKVLLYFNDSDEYDLNFLRRPFNKEWQLGLFYSAL